MFNLRVTTIFTALTMAATNFACAPSWQKDSRSTSEITFHNRLIRNLPLPAMQTRINELLIRHHNDCPELNNVDMEDLHFNVANGNLISPHMMQSMKVKETPDGPQWNCFSTALWVASGIQETIGTVELLDAGLSARKYHKAFEIRPYEINEKGVSIGLDESYPNSLRSIKPGDLLVFSGIAPEKGVPRNQLVSHVAVYLGEEDGEHYIFDKGSNDCGPVSTFAIHSLNEFIGARLGTTTSSLQYYHFGTIEVYRYVEHLADLLHYDERQRLGITERPVVLEVKSESGEKPKTATVQKPLAAKRSRSVQTHPHSKSPVGASHQSRRVQLKAGNRPKNSGFVSYAAEKPNGPSQRKIFRP